MRIAFSSGPRASGVPLGFRRRRPPPLGGQVCPQVVTVHILVHLEVAELALELVVGQVVLLQQLLTGEWRPTRRASDLLLSSPVVSLAGGGRGRAGVAI